LETLTPGINVCLEPGSSISCTIDGCTCSTGQPGWRQVPAAAVREAGVRVIEPYTSKLRFFKPEGAY
jgi:hypothetical protein